MFTSLAARNKVLQLIVYASVKTDVTHFDPDGRSSPNGIYFLVGLHAVIRHMLGHAVVAFSFSRHYKRSD